MVTDTCRGGGGGGGGGKKAREKERLESAREQTWSFHSTD